MHWHRKINLKLIPPIQIAFRRVAKSTQNKIKRKTQMKKSHKTRST